MHLGLTGLYQPKWSAIIEEEWQRNLIKDRPDLNSDQIKQTGELMNRALPDANDRHVVAAAICSNAEIVVTFNLKDFPLQYLNNFGIEALHPDDFITDLFDLNQALVLAAVNKQRRNMRKPPKSVDEYLDALLRQALPQTVKELSKFRALI